MGRFSPGHIGASLLSACESLGVEVIACDSDGAFAAPQWMRRLTWHLMKRRPPRLATFSMHVADLCREHAPDVLLSTGSAPINARALQEIGALGVRRLNYSTDDPWSAVHRSRWLLDALREYDAVFSPRRSNLPELRALDGPEVYYLPFAFDPQIHHDGASSVAVQGGMSCDVLFVGGADHDRVAVLGEIVREGFDVALYGGYWDRYSVTRSAARGLGSPDMIREATQGAKVCLCLVRRSNRDGHVMRSFELAAIGACMLVEDTEEHREMFGGEGKAVMYFQNPTEMISKLRWLLDHSSERASLGHAAKERVAIEANTYQARLSTMLASAESRAGVPSL